MYIYNPAFYGYKRAVSAQDAAPVPAAYCLCRPDVCPVAPGSDRRILDPTRTYCGCNASDGLVVYDYYQSYLDRISHGDRNLLLVYEWESPAVRRTPPTVLSMTPENWK